jgi:hypothetical protein
MAAAAAPPPTNPAAAFAAGDPRNAEYGENIAALEHAYNTTLAGDAETLGDAKSNAAYQRSLIGQAEPGGYRSEADKASSGGILESGVNAQNRATLASKYADQRFKVAKSLQETTDKVNKANANAEYTLNSGKSKAATKALGEGYKELLANAPNEEAPAAPPTPTNPGATRVNTGPPVAGGVQPHEESLPGGGVVRVGMPQKPQVAVRKAAAKKAVG